MSESDPVIGEKIVISKKITRRKNRSDPARLISYILDAKNQADPVLWMSPDEFQLSQMQGENKLAYFRMSQCEASVPGMAMVEMIATQKHNTRSKADKLYHLMISFPAGEIPTPEQLIDIEDSMCQALGYSEHQRVSAIHQDTENAHIHIVINKIHPTRFTCHEPYRDYYTRDKVCQAMEIKHGLIQDNHGNRRKQPDKAREMESHQKDSASLLSWVREKAGDALQECFDTGQSWQSLHQLLASFNLQIKPHGAGLVIVDTGSHIAVKASSVSRILAIKSLTEKWGVYEPPAKTQGSSAIHYQKKSPSKLSSDPLYAQYQQIRQTSLITKKTEKSALYTEQSALREANKAWYAARRKLIKNNPLLSSNEKRIEYKTLYKRQQEERLNFREAEKKAQELIKTNFPALTWDSFLQSKAQTGNSDALSLLRRKAQINHAPTRNWVHQSIKKPDIVPLILPSQPYQVDLRGNVHYTAADGGSVIDKANGIEVNKITQEAASIALKLAASRFAGRPLDVSGEESFKQSLITCVITEGLDIHFADPEMEQECQEKQTIFHDKSLAAVSTQALLAYVDARNGLRERIPTIKPHRPWRAEDSGEFIYQGTRKLADGSEAIILEKEGIMLVKPVDRMTLPTKMKIGQTFSLDKKGRYTEAEAQNIL